MDDVDLEIDDLVEHLFDERPCEKSAEDDEGALHGTNFEDWDGGGLAVDDIVVHWGFDDTREVSDRSRPLDGSIGDGLRSVVKDWDTVEIEATSSTCTCWDTKGEEMGLWRALCSGNG